MSLKYPNFIYERLTKYEPTLFSYKKDGNFNTYSRTCALNMGRQPIILTDEEKKIIDAKHPGSYTHSLRFGSTNKKFNYICPRYWCLKTNMPLSDKDVEEGVCGGKDAIIPRDAKVVPKGKFIYEFNFPKEHVGRTKDGKEYYIEHGPGFLKKACLPCCFKKWDSPAQIQRMRECMDDTGEEDKKAKSVAKKELAYEVDNYVKSSEKFPLEANRWGYLPLVMQVFLQIDKDKCNIDSSKNPPAFTECSLRHGVENHPSQSFVACIADVYIDVIKGKEIPSIKEMKKYIKEAVNLDLFIGYHNGNLVSSFSKIDNNNIDIEEYNDTDIYKKINKENESQLKYLKNIINAYINFNNYLDDDTVEIDHRYLWDIICSKNEKLFPKGLNLVIIEIPENDITNNVELICPTNYYSNTIFDIRKPTLLLMKKNNYFEPIYTYKDIQTTIEIKKTHLLLNTSMMSNIKIMFNKIKEYMNNYCGITGDKLNVYEYEANISLFDLKNNIEKIKDARIINQVINYNNKIIALIVNFNGINGYVPCLPSSIMEDINIIFIDEIEWNNYRNTIDFLTSLKEKNKSIKCSPLNKIEEQGLIVGILTETNQFIQIDPPEENKEPDLPVIKSSNYIVADKETLNNETIDVEREDFIHKLKLQENYYNVFRNTLRIVLNKPENKPFKNQFIEIIKSNDFLYFNKFEKILKTLKSILISYIEFVEYEEDVLKEIQRISLCDLDDNCDKPYCLRKDNGCVLLIPRSHLLNPKIDNEELYYQRLTDELIRFNRINKYIFDEKLYLTLENDSYNLKDDEILLFQNELTKEYFEDMIPAGSNKYVDSATFENVNPLYYSYSTKDVEQLKQSKKLITCYKNKLRIKKILSKKILEDSSNKYYEMVYLNNIKCSFEIILNILNDINKGEWDINKIKNLLIKEYTVNYKDYLNKIKDILSNEGKKFYIYQVFSKKLSLSDYIMSENYFLSLMDIWILSNTLNLPIIVISAGKITYTGEKYFVMNNNIENKYFILKIIISTEKKLYPEYRLIVDSKGSKNINTEEVLFKDKESDITESLKDVVEDSLKLDLRGYLDNYRIKKKKILLVK